MPRAFELEIFETGGDPFDAGSEGTESEEARLAGFEQGYSAGWDDSVAAQEDEIARLRTDLGRNLREMSLTYEDARSHVLLALEPLLKDMVTKILPAIARQSLGQIVLEQLRPVAGTMADLPVALVTHPMNRSALEKLIVEQAGLPVQIREEPSLSEGQAYLDFGARESKVDLDGVIAAITEAVAGFFHIDSQEEPANG